MKVNTNTRSTTHGARVNPSVSYFHALPDEALIDVRAVATLMSRSVNTVWRMAKAGIIAAPIKVGPKTTRWKVGAIRTYLNSLGS